MGAVIVTGIPGVGKTTVMDAAADKAGRPVVVYGSVMFEVAQAAGLVTDRDDMRKMEPARQREVQQEAAKRIAAQGDVVVDTHCTIKTPRGYLPGLPRWVLEDLKPDTVVLVEATPAEIAGRRAGDATRKRDDDSEEAIATHQEWNRRFSAAYAVTTGATVATVYNHNDRLDDAVAQLLEVL